MHTEKTKIFDDYAKSQGFISWDHLDVDYRMGLMNKDEFLSFMFEACDLVQKAQQDRIAENMNWDRCKNQGSECRTDKHSLSITSENNLIK